MTTTTTSTRVRTGADNGRLLRMMLRENAIFSAVSGTILAAGSPLLDDWIGVQWWILLGLGVGLIGFAVSLWFGTTRPALLRATGQAAVAGDIGWIIGAIAIVVATSWLTRSGEIALLAVSAVVALLAIGQATGLRRLKA